jgi:hypothetical protein
MDLITATKIAANLYECQETLQRLLGSKYEAAIEPWKEIIRDEHAKHGGDLMPFALALLKGMNEEGVEGPTMMFAMAAVVEIAEEQERQG